MKKCSKCGAEKTLDLFPKTIRSKDGYCVQCKQCKNEYRRLNQHKYLVKQQIWYKENPEKLLQYKQTRKENPEFKKIKANADKKYREKHAEQLKLKKQQYYCENKERHRENMAVNYQNNKEQIKQRVNEWKKDNAARVNAIVMRRYANKLKATPSWLTEDDHWMLEQAYDLAKLRTQMFGFKWHVDHIVPLQGKIVCGLHVPNNLQVIPASINCSKSNRFEA